MAKIDVTSPENTYTIHIDAGLLGEVAQRPADYAIHNPIIVSNTTVAPLHGETFAQQLNAPLIALPDGEQHKTLDTVAGLYGDLIHAKADRKSTLIALGGGVIGDSAGFAAASYMRGIDLVQVPTSLLSMVDSSVGGKVGVDLPQGKNLVGAFKQPKAVLIDTDVLSTLPDAEWANGMAEIIKHGLIADPELLNTDHQTRAHAQELVTRAVQVKVNIVQIDPYEHAERAYLNLGHTFAHAVEQVTGYQWAHGQAVGFGLLAAGWLSYELGQCDRDLVGQIEHILTETGLPTRITPDIASQALWEAMHTDKKWGNGRNRFVLLHEVGQPFIMENVSHEAVISVLDRLTE
jgi:shikimate kinase/3-dehydroquinate synthase